MTPARDVVLHTAAFLTIVAALVAPAPAAPQEAQVVESLEVHNAETEARITLSISGPPGRITGGEEAGNSVVLRLAGMVPGPATSNLSFAEGLVAAVFLGVAADASEPTAVLTVRGRERLSYSLRQKAESLVVSLQQVAPAVEQTSVEESSEDRIAPAVPLAVRRRQAADEVDAGDQRSKVKQDLRDARKALDVSEAEIRRLVSQLSAAESARAASEQRQLELSQQLEQLIRESEAAGDRLSLLERANEELAAELRQLREGLVAEPEAAEEPPAEDTPAPAEPRPAPEETDLPSAAELAGVAREWAAAWTSRDVEAVLGFYSEDFKRPRGMRKDAWKDMMEARIERPEFVEVTIENLEARVDAPDRGAVTFRQSYMSDMTAHTTRKTLELVLEEGVWRILEERAE